VIYFLSGRERRQEFRVETRYASRLIATRTRSRGVSPAGAAGKECEMTNGRMPPDAGSSHAPRAPTGVDADHKVQDAIGRALEAHYVALVREPIPDRLLDLLAKLEAGELRHE
jgi:Anti-sigma factor NepR